jgi:hypothetical protein
MSACSGTKGAPTHTASPTVTHRPPVVIAGTRKRYIAMTRMLAKSFLPRLRGELVTGAEESDPKPKQRASRFFSQTISPRSGSIVPHVIADERNAL